MFGQEPFASNTRMSNLKNYKYDLYWDKKIGSGMCNCKIQPMRQVETISIFIEGKSHYYPQMTKRDKPIKNSTTWITSDSFGNSGCKQMPRKIYDEKYPTTLLSYLKIRQGALHPTQKPVELLEYLIKSYSQENEVVLDSCCGSGSTLVAAKNTNRKFIGIEKEEKYFEIIKERLN